MMMPFLLIGAGKVALNHFRHAGMLLGDGSPLKVFGIPDETVSRILQDKDVNRAGELLQKSLRNSPLWGLCTFLGRLWSGLAPWMKPESLFEDGTGCERFFGFAFSCTYKALEDAGFPRIGSGVEKLFLIRIMLRPEPSGCCVPVCPAWVKPPQRTGSLFMRRNRLPVWR